MRKITARASFYTAFCLMVLLGKTSFAQNDHLKTAPDGRYILTVKGASHFAGLALKCVGQEYPNKPGNVLESAADALTPQAMHPSFYGCYDWHSSVHGHWMLVRLLKQFPQMPEAEQIRKVLAANLSASNINAEAAYFSKPVNASFERTYGWAWLLKLSLELHNWDNPEARKWKANLQPLVQIIEKRYADFLPKQTYPIRQGMHPNTAFGLSFAYDYAKALKKTELLNIIVKRSKDYFGSDTDAPLKWEPNGADFLSPALEEADLMRRVLPPAAFKTWLTTFIPHFADKKPKNILEPAIVGDRSDLQIVHLDGLNLSRAWCMNDIAAALGKDDPLYSIFRASAKKHLDTVLPNIASGEYGGEHWLASFAVYALSAE